MHTRTHTDSKCITHSAFDTNTFRALPNTLPSTHSFTLSQTASPFPLFLALHMVQKLYFWLTRLEHKGSSYASWRSPTREASIPSWIVRLHTDRVSPLFFSLPFPYRIKPLGFWMVCTIFFHPSGLPPPNAAFSRSKLNDQLDNQLINQLFLMSIHAHCWARGDAEWMDLIGVCAVRRALQSPHSSSLFSPSRLRQGQKDTKKSFKDIKSNLTFYGLITVTLNLQRFRLPSNQNNFGCYSWSALFL